MSALRQALTFAFCAALAVPASASDGEVSEPATGIEERLGEYIPVDLELVDETGETHSATITTEPLPQSAK